MFLKKDKYPMKVMHALDAVQPVEPMNQQLKCVIWCKVTED
jgi:hypothetical protein